jgi:RluA family pseudouridine synthase
MSSFSSEQFQQIRDAKAWRHTPPYQAQYKHFVRPDEAGQSVLDFFTKRFSFRPREYWNELIEVGKISVNRQGVEAGQTLQIDDEIITVRDDVQEPDVNEGFETLYNENGVLVLAKSAPLPIHPSGRFFKNSLLNILKEREPDQVFHTIHRLDLWTTGVLILGTEREAARFLHWQVEKNLMKKTYAVLARGEFGEKPFVIDEQVGREDGAHRGFGESVTEGKPAVTQFTPLAKREGITLLKAMPVTGRTNQIRVHVQAAGGSVWNDPLYSENPVSEELIPGMGLHCREMTFGVKKPEAVLPEKFFSSSANENLLNDLGEAQCCQAPWPAHYKLVFSENELDTWF